MNGLYQKEIFTKEAIPQDLAIFCSSAMIPLMETILPIIQIIISILLIVTILLQRTGTGIEGALGGGESNTGMGHTRRGSEKFIFQATIVLAVLFAAATLAALFL